MIVLLFNAHVGYRCRACCCSNDCHSTRLYLPVCGWLLRQRGDRHILYVAHISDVDQIGEDWFVILVYNVCPRLFLHGELSGINWSVFLTLYSIAGVLLGRLCVPNQPDTDACPCSHGNGKILSPNLHCILHCKLTLQIWQSHC